MVQQNGEQSPDKMDQQKNENPKHGCKMHLNTMQEINIES